MNNDSFNCVKTLLKSIKTFTVYIVIAETNVGQHSFYGLTENEDWEYLFSPDHLKQYEMRNYKFLHLFTYSFTEDLKWIESRNLENQESVIPVDLTDEVVEFLVDAAKKSGITVNDVMVDILRDYITKEIKLNENDSH